MNFLTIFTIFFALLATIATARHVYEVIEEDSIEQQFVDYEIPKFRVRRAENGFLRRIKRAYGCGYLSSNHAECAEHCRTVEKCHGGKCVGRLKQTCWCMKKDNTSC
ncbi:hypothetical protein CAEBREN_00173 [Caenorhabditis brenneri]|uniref:Invertebrate defensins family profile domain-containing protein n=1 Tax=Caenorhabditis brenneri TaxID=135651 RepID=G0MWM7_CAEBE|nr:hypothetical protein CAEBREN_00173 [Caenorhabditis brenneri]